MKSLAKDTVVYGLSSIIGKFLNYLLVPLYTHVISAESGGYGIVTNLYAYTALVMVILTFGMETSFFRFANSEEEKSDTVFSTAMLFVSSLAIVFFVTVCLFINPLADVMGYAGHHEYVLIMSAIVSIDVIQAIPFCLLRFRKKALKFAMLKLLFIVVSIALNLLFFLVLGKDDVYYVFFINLICTFFITFFFITELTDIKWKVDMTVMRRMLSYSWPILVLGIAGILNQTFDKIIFPWAYTRTGLYTDAEAHVQLGIYGACVKVAMIMAMITQAFRYAYEPIVFAKSKEKDSKEYYAVAMKYFIIFTLFAFLCVEGYIDLLKNIIDEEYHSGLFVIPIVMVAEIMMGIYFNLSFWYKLIDKTIWGAWFSLAGCAVLIIVNIVFIPVYGYVACAWGGVAGYMTSMVLSYVVGQIKNPIKYDMKGIIVYVLMTSCIFSVMYVLPDYVDSVVSRLLVNTFLISLFAGHVIFWDLPIKKLPVIGRFFR